MHIYICSVCVVGAVADFSVKHNLSLRVPDDGVLLHGSLRHAPWYARHGVGVHVLDVAVFELGVGGENRSGFVEGMGRRGEGRGVG